MQNDEEKLKAIQSLDPQTVENQTRLPAMIGKANPKQIVSALERLVPEEVRKHVITETEVNLVLMDIFKSWPSIPTTDVIEFFYLAMTTGAKPLNKDIYLVPYNKYYQGSTQQKGQSIFSYHFLNKCAELTGKLDSIQVRSFFRKELTESGEEKPQLLAECSVWKAGFAKPFQAEVYFNEVVQTTKSGKDMGLWGKSPRAMLEKCAVAKAIRLAFPNALGGYYTEEELDLMKPEKQKDSNTLSEVTNIFRENAESATNPLEATP